MLYKNRNCNILAVFRLKNKIFFVSGNYNASTTYKYKRWYITNWCMYHKNSYKLLKILLYVSYVTNRISSYILAHCLRVRKVLDNYYVLF